MFKVLMTNGIEVQKLHNAQMVAGGLATERYGVYLQGVEAAQNKATASWERMWAVSLNSGSIKIFYQLSSAILDTVSAFGGLPTIIGVATTALILFNLTTIQTTLTAMSAMGISLTGLIASFEALAVALINEVAPGMLLVTGIMDANPIGAVVVVVSALILALGYFSQASQRAAEDAKKLVEEVAKIKTNLSSLNSELKSIRELGSAFEELRKITKKTVEEKQKFLDVQNQLKDIMPQLAGKYDSEGNFILEESVNLKTLVDLKNEQIKVEKELLEIKSTQSMGGQKQAYEAERKEIESLKKELETGQRTDKTSGRPVTFSLSPEALKASQARLKELLITHQLTATQIKETFYQMSPDDQKLYAGFISGLKGAKDAVRAFDDWMIDDAENNVEKLVGIYESFGEDVKSIVDTLASTSDIMAKSLDGTLELSDVEKLISVNEDYINAITIIEGQVKVNTEALRIYDIQKADDILTTAIQNNASQKQIDILRAYRDALVSGTAYAPVFAKAQADAQKVAETAANKAREAIEKQISAAKKLLDMVVNMIKDRKSAEKDALQSQLEGYKALIQARKDALDAKKAEDDYNRSVEKQSEAISTMQTEIDILALDTSAEAIAQRLKLESEIAGKKETLEEDQNQHSVDIQKASLDQQEAEYEKMIDNRIASIDSYLAQSGKMMQDAQRMITKNADKTYKELINWNMLYGDGLRSSVVSAWSEGAKGVTNLDSLVRNLNNINLTPFIDQIKNVGIALGLAASSYQSLGGSMVGLGSISGYGSGMSFGGGASALTLAQAAKAFSNTSTSGGTSTAKMQIRHSGVDTGFVQGLKSNEEFAKLMAGEIVITPNQMDTFMNKTLPKVAQMSRGETLSIGKLLEITVQGNMDGSVVPQIKEIADKVVKQINENMKQRGFIRTTSLTSI